MKYYAIIVAAGHGSRMQSDLPKQFLLLEGKPVLMHSIEAFYLSEVHPEIIVVLSSGFVNEWKTLCEKYHFNVPHQICEGGDTRFYSVKNALKTIEKHSITAIHDGARPLVPKWLIANGYQMAKEKGNAIAAVKSTDSLRLVKGNSTTVLNRDEVYRIQTPQTFQSDLLIAAYEQPYSEAFSDDATVVEKAGSTICLIEGASDNIKITYPVDLAIAEQLLKNSNREGK